jgi:tRNA(fMet)-specific endonuclease VapC
MASIERVLIDTDVASYLMKGGTNAQRYAPFVENKLVAISFVTVGEMYYGAYLDGWGKRKLDALEEHLKRFVVIPYDGEITLRFAALYAARQKAGDRMSFPDAWIAACAVRHAIPLITNNAKDYRGIDSLEVRTAPEIPPVQQSLLKP